MSDYSKEYEPIDNIQCSLGAIEGELDGIRNNINLLIEQYRNRKEQMDKDAVSREAALKEMERYHNDCAETSEYTRLGFETAMEVVKSLPSVTPKQKTGKWLPTSDIEKWGYKCSVCGGIHSTDLGNYCMWCGAEMAESMEQGYITWKE